jgi:hypothetical protein
MTGNARDGGAWQDRERCGRHFRHVAEIIVDRLRLVGGDIADQGSDAAFRLARKQDDAKIECRLKIGRPFRQHGKATVYMKAADYHRNASGAKLAGKIDRTRELIGLYADEPDEAGAGFTNFSDRAIGVDDCIALVVGLDVDIDIGTEQFLGGTFCHQPVYARQAVGGDKRPPPLNDVAVGVVMRRLDQDGLESPLSHLTSSWRCTVTQVADKATQPRRVAIASEPQTISEFSATDSRFSYCSKA